MERRARGPALYREAGVSPSDDHRRLLSLHRHLSPGPGMAAGDSHGTTWPMLSRIFICEDPMTVMASRYDLQDGDVLGGRLLEASLLLLLELGVTKGQSREALHGEVPGVLALPTLQTTPQRQRMTCGNQHAETRGINHPWHQISRQAS